MGVNCGSGCGTNLASHRDWGGFVVFEQSASFDHRTPGAVGGLLTGCDNDASDGQRDRESSDDVPAIFLQGIGSVDGRTESAAGTIVSLRATTFTRCTCIFLTILQRAFARDFEGEVLSRGCAGSDLHVGVGLLRVVHGLE